MARPKKNIDVDLIKKLASIHCTTEEIASITGVHVRTIERRFAVVIKDARNHGRMSLKRKQFEVALGGNAQMLIWLGKIYLEQKDTTRLELNDEIVDTYISQKSTTDTGTEIVVREKTF